MQLLTWERREQPHFGDLHDALMEEGFPVYLVQVKAKGGKQALLVSKTVISQAEAQARYQHFLDTGE